MITNVKIVVLEATDYAARLRLEVVGPTGSLTGTIRGPRCAGHSTLPATFALRPTAKSNIAEAEILEPCYWSAEQPFVYDASVTIRDLAGASHTWTDSIALSNNSPSRTHGPDF
jgi:hypothetical protein